jgi:hypothetical protein
MSRVAKIRFARNVLFAVGLWWGASAIAVIAAGAGNTGIVRPIGNVMASR